jgi:hypothetical protein
MQRHYLTMCQHKKTMRSSICYRLVFFLFFASFAQLCFSQQTEIKANIYSGSFSFFGSGSASTTHVTYNDMGYFNTYPYGRKSGFSYAMELQTQRIIRKQFLYGIGLGFEHLESKVNVDSVYTDMGIKPSLGDNVRLLNKFIAVSPYVGKRFTIKNLKVDFIAGVDLAYSIAVNEKAAFLTSKKHFSKGGYKPDYRPRIQGTVSYNKLSVAIGYSRGTENVFHWGYLNKVAYSQYLRFGFGYRIK